MASRASKGRTPGVPAHGWTFAQIAPFDPEVQNYENYCSKLKSNVFLYPAICALIDEVYPLTLEEAVLSWRVLDPPTQLYSPCLKECSKFSVIKQDRPFILPSVDDFDCKNGNAQPKYALGRDVSQLLKNKRPTQG